jgi:hypothetical protein|tara:strand:- start:809 stop:1459 length:651 start_codon:yes stop_codon:yes gene_type:complete
MKTQLISFYSDIEDRTYYSDHGKRLKENCDSLDIPYDIQEKESLGTYQNNCLSKPQFLLDTLNEKQHPILWMDVDSLIHKSLDVYDQFEGSDIDVVLTTANGMISGIKASPLYFNNTEGARDFISMWIEQTKIIKKIEKEWFDHEPLFGVVQKMISEINIRFVGPEYCIWPGYTNENTVVTMGLADAESKKDVLRRMGLSEDKIQWQTPGNNGVSK